MLKNENPIQTLLLFFSITNLTMEKDYLVLMILKRCYDGDPAWTYLQSDTKWEGSEIGERRPMGLRKKIESIPKDLEEEDEFVVKLFDPFSSSFQSI